MGCVAYPLPVVLKIRFRASFVSRGCVDVSGSRPYIPLQPSIDCSQGINLGSVCSWLGRGVVGIPFGAKFDSLVAGS